MSRINICEPSYDFIEDPWFRELFASPDRAKCIEQEIPYSLEVELTNKCVGSCLICYSASDDTTDVSLESERVFELIDEGLDLGVRSMLWVGGDPVLHRDWFAIVNYSIEKGMRNSIFSSTLISKKLAKELVQIKNGLDMVGIHIDTINQEIYNKLHTNPKSLQEKIRGYHNLLDAGYPPERVMGCITLTKYSVKTIEETLDWHIGEMGSKFVGLLAFKREGFGGLQRDFEPSLSEVKQAHEYRAKKLGKDLLKIGSSDVGLRFCRSNVYIKFDGRVTPCPMLSDLAVSNIYEKSMGDILTQHRDSLLFNSKIKGFCGNGCGNRDVCFGCRATAYHYTGDVYASDPKCWMNPEANEYYS